MLNNFYRLMNTISSTVWILVMFVIKERWTILSIPWWATSTIVIFLTIGLSFISLLMTRGLSKDNLDECLDIEQADNSFLPSYVGYFLIGLSVDKMLDLMIVWAIISVFLYLVRAQYFNATYLLFGYHYYHITTIKGTKLFLISNKEIRTACNLKLPNLRRINDTTYIDYIERRK